MDYPSRPTTNTEKYSQAAQQAMATADRKRVNELIQAAHEEATYYRERCFALRDALTQIRNAGHVALSDMDGARVETLAHALTEITTLAGGDL